MSLVERTKGILQSPKSEWKAIEGEPDDVGALFWNYVVPLAAIPPVAAFIGTSITGYVGFRLGFVSGLVRATTVYVLSLAGVFVTAYVIDFLAETFRGQRNFGNALKVSVYAPTAAWLASIFDVNPAIAFLSLMGLYSFYLLFTGLAALMKPPPNMVLLYTVSVSVCVFVFWLAILGVPAAMIFGVRALS